MKTYCYLNGKITKSNRASLPLNDLAILRGFGVIDFVRTYNGKPFRLKDHYLRFVNSAKILGLKVPVTETELAKILTALKQKNRLTEATFRFILTGGPTNNYITPSGPANFYIIADDLMDFPPTVFKKGGKLITAEYERPKFGAKNTNYLTTVSLQKERQQKKALEILFIKDGLVLEASTSNIFIVKNQTLITPTDRILHGITRKVTLELAKKLKIKTEIRPVTVAELLSADECFITATNKKITPIIQIDNKKINSGTPGPITKQLLSSFNDYTNNY